MITGVGDGGTDIGGKSDQFHFFYQTFSNDFDVSVRIESLANSDVWAKAGLLARETLDANSAGVTVLASPTLSGCFFETRSVAGGALTLKGSFPVNFPQNWLRLQRTGDVFNGYASLDGQTWSLLGSTSLIITNPLYFGLAASSHTTNLMTSARFRDLSFVTNGIIGNLISPSEPLGPSSRKTGLVIDAYVRRAPTASCSNTSSCLTPIRSPRISADTGCRATSISRSRPIRFCRAAHSSSWPNRRPTSKAFTASRMSSGHTPDR